MKKKPKGKVLTKAEEKLWSAMKRYDTVAFASQKIGLAPKTAYNMLYRLRKKYLKARRFVNFVEANKKSYRIIRMVMTSRAEQAEGSDLWEEEKDE